MSDFQRNQDILVNTLNTALLLAPRIVNITGVTAIGTGAWLTANLAIFVPFTVPVATTVAQVFWFNGSTVGNNHVNVGIYDSQQNQITSTGSTLTAGASAAQVVDITDVVLKRGLYYMVMVVDGTTDTFSRLAPSSMFSQSWGVLQQTSAFSLPNPATFAKVTTSYMPIFGLTQLAVF